jgi:hypothetical protein
MIQLQFYPDAERVIRMRSRHYDSAYILSTVSWWFISNSPMKRF